MRLKEVWRVDILAFRDGDMLCHRVNDNDLGCVVWSAVGDVPLDDCHGGYGALVSD